jgi:hypothetical protein
VKLSILHVERRVQVIDGHLGRCGRRSRTGWRTEEGQTGDEQDPSHGRGRASRGDSGVDSVRHGVTSAVSALDAGTILREPSRPAAGCPGQGHPP